MSLLTVILLIAALACFVLAAFGFAAKKINLIALGLACWILPSVISALQSH